MFSFSSVALLSASLIGLAVATQSPSAPSGSAFAFDRQYLNASTLSTGNEYWAFVAVSEPQPGKALSALMIEFVEGSGENVVQIAVTLPNGTMLSALIPASNASVTSDGQQVDGSWECAGNFNVTGDLSTVSVTIDAPDYGVFGTVVIHPTAPPHFPCNTTSSPYMAGYITPQSDVEAAFLETSGWTNAVPSGHAKVSLSINDTLVRFSGNGYQDQTFTTATTPVPLSWYFATLKAGPYSLVSNQYVLANTSYPIVTGYLAHDDNVLQNQCSHVGLELVNTVITVPYGSEPDKVTNSGIPAGFSILATLASGELYSFDAKNQGVLFNGPGYTIFFGTTSGGKVGGYTYEGTAVMIWQTPS